MNADGCGDVVVGAYREDGGAVDGGRAYVFSGQTGGLLCALQSSAPESAGQFGCSVSGVGDVDSDGYDEVIIGARNEDGGASSAGRAYVFAGNGGAILYVTDSPSPELGGDFGFAVSGAGDLNSDGHVDILVGAYNEDAATAGAGRAYVFNGIEVPIELASFAGEPCGVGVRLVWLTLTEQNNLGFNLERAACETSAFVLLNEEIIPGAGTSTVPHSYEYLDRAVQPGTTYWYRLEDISLDGERTRHGPINVAVPNRPEIDLRVLGGSDPTFVLTFARPGRASLRLYDVGGNLVATLWEGDSPALGSAMVRPDLRGGLPTGLYTASLSQGGLTVRRPVVIAR